MGGGVDGSGIVAWEVCRCGGPPFFVMCAGGTGGGCRNRRGFDLRKIGQNKDVRLTSKPDLRKQGSGGHQSKSRAASPLRWMRTQPRPTQDGRCRNLSLRSIRRGEQGISLRDARMGSGVVARPRMTAGGFAGCHASRATPPHARDVLLRRSEEMSKPRGSDVHDAPGGVSGIERQSPQVIKEFVGVPQESPDVTVGTVFGDRR